LFPPSFHCRSRGADRFILLPLQPHISDILSGSLPSETAFGKPTGGIEKAGRLAVRVLLYDFGDAALERGFFP